MPRLKLTKTSIAKINAPDPSGKQVLWWDTELRGFAVLASGKTNAKTYVVQRDVNGRSRRITVGPINVLDLDDAREWAGEILAQMYQGIDPKAQRHAKAANAISLRDALESYLVARKTLKPRTASDYRKVIDRYLGDWLAKPLRDITPDMVETRHRAIKVEIEARGRSELARGHSSANAAMRVLRIIWNHMKDRVPDLPDNPVRRLRRAWYPEKPRQGVVKASELPAFYDAVTKLPNPIHRDYILTILFTGLRRNEAAALRWDEVDLQERVIRLSDDRTKTGRKLDLPMSDFLGDLFTARRSIGQDGPYVFPADSRSGHIEEPRFSLDAVSKETGIKVTVHDLRRTFITVAESCDIPHYALKGLVNHSMGSDVTAGYVVAGAERLREPMQRVTDKFKELIGIKPPEDENVVKLG